MIEEIKAKALTSEFDYNFLLSCLSGYKKPRDYITKLIKQKLILPVKKGLYVFGPNAHSAPYSKELLANLIYGPSYISKQYALGFYDLIPEKVAWVTSVTPKRKKYFHTAVGDFSYDYLHPDKYVLGIVQQELDSHHRVLMACPEKALVDILWQEKGIQSVVDLQSYLDDHLRLDPSGLESFDLEKIRGFQSIFQSRVLQVLIHLLEEK